MNKIIVSALFCLQFAFVSLAQETAADKAGKQTFDAVNKSYGIFINKPLLAEVTSIGRALEKHLNFTKPIKYFLVDTPEPNAFATNGGYVYVTRGLLSIINTRDELAGIMAHEISHVTQNHPRKTTQAHIIPAILEIPGNLANLLTSSKIGNIVNVPIEVIFSVPLASYSRHNEKEADLIGVDLATKAGFDPYGLVRALERLEEYVDYIVEVPMEKSIFIDHPMTVDRVAYLTSHLKSLGFERTADKSGTNMKNLDGLLYGLNPMYGVIQANRYANPVFDFQAQLPESWLYDITKNTVTTVSKDKKAILVFKSDTSSTSIYQMMHKVKSRITTMKISSLDSNDINGLKAYRMIVLDVPNKLTYDMIWMQLPGENKYVQISAVYYTNADNKEVLEFVNSFKRMQQEDIKSMYYRTIVLEDNVAGKPMETYVSDYTTDSIAVQLTSIFNNADATKPIDSSNAYVKVIKKNPLVLYKEE